MMMQISPIRSSQEPHDKKPALEGVVGACSLISWIWRQLAESVTNLGDLRRPFQMPELDYCTLTQNR